MSRQSIAILFAALLPGTAWSANTSADTAPEIYASVYSCNYWKEHNFDEVGIYRFRTDKYERELVNQDPDLDASGGGAMTDDFYFCTQEYDYGAWTEITHYIIDPDEWTVTSSLRDGLETAVATDLAYDPTTAKLFGCFNGEGGSMVFGTIDTGTGEVFKIADIETPWIACSTDRNGNLYAIDMNGGLLAVDKIHGRTETLGNLGFTATRRSTGAIDTRTGIFYVVVTNSKTSDDPWVDYELNDSHLYAVDIEKVTATYLYEFEDGEALGGMYIPGETALDGAPAQVTDLALDFPDGSLSGTASFTVPTTTFDGKAASGSVGYLLRANGALLAQGTAAYGEKVSRTVSVNESALYKIELRLSNAVGNSPRTKMKMWLGPDMPKAMEAPELSYGDGSFTLAWTAPSESQNGGYFNPEKVSYKIVRQPDNTVVADNCKATTFSEAVAQPDGVKAYHYDVTMLYDGTAFKPISSNVWRLGSAPLPYKTTFDDENSLDDYTIINADGDDIRWYREWDFYIELTDELISVVSHPYTSSLATGESDDWLLTPPFRLNKGLTYRLSYESLTNYEGDSPTMAVYIGQGPTKEAMTTVLKAPETESSLLPEKHSADITVPADGTYYIGFHACSGPGKNAIALVSVALEADLSGIGSPEASENVRIEAGKGSIRISAPAGTAYSIYNPDGRLAANGSTGADGRAETTLATGIYIVKAGGKTVKTIVR